MKNTLMMLGTALISFIGTAQTTIEYPATGCSRFSSSEIEKIVITDSTTEFYFHTLYTPGGWISIPRKTYIVPVAGGDTLFIKGTEGIPLRKRYVMPPSGEVSYKLIFPRIDPSVDKLDYGEVGGNWFIYDIVVKPDLYKIPLPKSMRGVWYNGKSGESMIAFLDTVAVFQQRVWRYGQVNLAGGKGSIELIRGNQSMRITTKTTSKGIDLVLPSAQKFSLTRTSKASKSDASDVFTLPVFRLDTTVYSGFISNYSPRLGAKTLMIYIDDIIVGKQRSYIAEINQDGTFSTRLPLYYPHKAFIRSSVFNGSVYLEPGKETFQVVGVGWKTTDMGATSKLNTDLDFMEKINLLSYGLIKDTILSFSPKAFKTFCHIQYAKDSAAVSALRKQNIISAKAEQVKQLDLLYNYFSVMIEYKNRYTAQYREKNKIAPNDEVEVIPSDSIKADYFSFITSKTTNSPIAVISDNYDEYINKLTYLSLLSKPIRSERSLYSTIEVLTKEGFAFNSEERRVIAGLKRIDSIENTPERKLFNEKYNSMLSEFNKKYRDTLKLMPKGRGSLADKVAFLTSKGITLTEAENTFVQASYEKDEWESSKEIRRIYISMGDTFIRLTKRISPEMNRVAMERYSMTRINNLTTILGVAPGFASSLIYANSKCRKITEELTPVSDTELKRIQTNISDSFIANYVAVCNQETLAKIAAHNNNRSSKMINTPLTKADALFDSIMVAYRGKVVLVDFWATWCGPCRAGIEQIKPLKEEMDSSKFAFVYITNPSSPEGTWKNMITGIRGEHYRVSQDEWNYFATRFGISGIPHYAMVNTKGEVVNADVPHAGNDGIKKMMENTIESKPQW